MNSYETKLSAEIAAFAALPETTATSLFEVIYDYSFRDYTTDYTSFFAFIKIQCNLYFDKLIQEYKQSHSQTLKEELHTIALNQFHRRYDVLIRLEDEAYFEFVKLNAYDFLRGEDYRRKHGFEYEGGQVLMDLMSAYYIPQYTAEVKEFFNTAFEFASTYAMDHKKYDYLSGHPESTVLLLLAQSMNTLKEKDREVFAPHVFKLYEFCSGSDKSYSINQTSGFIAIQLTSYVQSFNLDVLKKAIEVTGKNYKSNTYVHQTLYAKWVLEKNGKEALEYLQAEENKDWPSLPVIAIADLDYKEALPIIETMLTEKQDPVVVEILLEAITRLKDQKTAPDTNDRMIWLNGNVSPTQRALGIESDNVFIKRAKQKQTVDATVYETDEE